MNDTHERMYEVHALPPMYEQTYRVTKLSLLTSLVTAGLGFASQLFLFLGEMYQAESSAIKAFKTQPTLCEVAANEQPAHVYWTTLFMYSLVVNCLMMSVNSTLYKHAWMRRSKYQLKGLMAVGLTSFFYLTLFFFCQKNGSDEYAARLLTLCNFVRTPDRLTAENAFTHGANLGRPLTTFLLLLQPALLMVNTAITKLEPNAQAEPVERAVPLA